MTTSAAAPDPTDLLTSLVGKWEGTSRVWFEPDKPVDDSPVRGRIRRIGDSPFLLHEYEGTFEGEAREGVEILGLNLEVEGGAFLSAWVDSFHMSNDVLLSRGNNAPDGFAVLGSYTADHKDSSSPRWGWRTHFELKDPNTLTITAYNIRSGGEEAKATETTSTRRA